MLRLYDYLPSGNGYKVRLLLSHLEIPFELVELDIVKGETRTPEFLAKNPNGKIPVLETEDGRCLPESNAILWYLAEGTPFVPADRWGRAEALRWMFFEQYSHEPYVAVARFMLMHLDEELPPEQALLLAEKQERGYAALTVMERHLAAQAWFAGGAYSIADIALYAYTHVAAEGGFDLTPFGAIRGWLARVATQPGHVAITQR
jgi:glutathione S-transferase